MRLQFLPYSIRYCRRPRPFLLETALFAIKSSIDRAAIRASERLRGAPRHTRWRRHRTVMIGRSDQNVQYTCFSSLSMHFRCTNTIVFPMLERDRHTLAMVVQTTTMLSRYGHDMRVRFPRAHVGPWCHAWTSALHLLAIFRREARHRGAMPRKRRKRRS